MSPDRSLTDRLQGGGPPGAPPAGPRQIHEHLTQPVVQQLARADAHRIVDLGCGNGWFSAALDRCGFDVTGVDRDADEVMAARARHPGVRFEVMDATHGADPAFAASFDAVVAIDLVDHVAEPRRMIETALALVKPGGTIVLTTSFHGYAKNVALALAGRFDSRWEPHEEGGRVKFFSRRTLLALLEPFDLAELRLQTVGRIPMFARAMLVSAKAR